MAPHSIFHVFPPVQQVLTSFHRRTSSSAYRPFILCSFSHLSFLYRKIHCLLGGIYCPLNWCWPTSQLRAKCREDFGLQGRADIHSNLKTLRTTYTFHSVYSISRGFPALNSPIWSLKGKKKIHYEPIISLLFRFLPFREWIPAWIPDAIHIPVQRSIMATYRSSFFFKLRENIIYCQKHLSMPRSNLTIASKVYDLSLDGGGHFYTTLDHFTNDSTPSCCWPRQL